MAHVQQQDQFHKSEILLLLALLLEHLQGKHILHTLTHKHRLTLPKSMNDAMQEAFLQRRTRYQLAQLAPSRQHCETKRWSIIRPASWPVGDSMATPSKFTYRKPGYGKRRHCVGLRDLTKGTCVTIGRSLGFVKEDEFGNYDNGVDSDGLEEYENIPKSVDDESCDHDTNRVINDEDDQADEPQALTHHIHTRDSMELCRDKSKDWTHHAGHPTRQSRYEKPERPKAGRRVTFDAAEVTVIVTDVPDDPGNTKLNPAASSIVDYTATQSSKSSTWWTPPRPRLSWLRPLALTPVHLSTTPTTVATAMAVRTPATPPPTQVQDISARPNNGTLPNLPPLLIPSRRTSLWTSPAPESQEDLLLNSFADEISVTPPPSERSLRTLSAGSVAQAALASAPTNSPPRFLPLPDLGPRPSTVFADALEEAQAPVSPNRFRQLQRSPPKRDARIPAPQSEFSKPGFAAAVDTIESDNEDYDTPVLRSIKFAQNEREIDRMYCHPDRARQLARYREPRGDMVLFGVDGPRVKTKEEMQMMRSMQDRVIGGDVGLSRMGSYRGKKLPAALPKSRGGLRGRYGEEVELGQ